MGFRYMRQALGGPTQGVRVTCSWRGGQGRRGGGAPAGRSPRLGSWGRLGLLRFPVRRGRPLEWRNR